MDDRSKTLVLHPLSGQTFKHYRIEGVLGQGGMGVVFAAQDLKLQRKVALKLLPMELTSDADRRKRFLVEARTAARLTHPAIAQVYDVDEDHGSVFIAMELVEGRTVRELIQERRLDLLTTVDVAVQVAGGLAKAHEAGIVHRDIKPANIILTPDGHAKILDFGLVKLLDADSSVVGSAGNLQDISVLTRTQTGLVKGTPAYMSPEQVKGETLDGRSDLFSLGATLFEMTSGEVPFRRTTSVEMMHAIAFDTPPLLRPLDPQMPRALSRIIQRCLQNRPADRYPDARSLANDLRSVRREMEAGVARPVSFPDQVRDRLGMLARLKPSEYAWLAGGAAVIGFGLYLLLSHNTIGSLVPMIFVGLMLYRNLRNRPRQAVDTFVKQISSIPEVRFIACQDRKIVVGVDRAASKLYSRINSQLNLCNRKVIFGEPLSVSIREDPTAEETRTVLTGPGVHYVRENTGPAKAN